VAVSGPAAQAGSDVYAVTSGRTQGPWTVRNVLMEASAADVDGMVPYTLLVEVDDISGVLNEVTGVIARRGYNIQSLAVGNCEAMGQSRITLVLPGQPGSVSKLIKQLVKLIVVQNVVDLTAVPHVVRELMLIKVCAWPCMTLCLAMLCISLLVRVQTSVVPRRCAGRFVHLHVAHASCCMFSSCSRNVRPLSLQVRCTPQQRTELKTLAEIYKGQIAHLTAQTMTMEVIGTEEDMHQLQTLLTPYGVLEVARTGRIALERESRVDSALLQSSQLRPYV
jgi:acetolactate synthase small subunit